MDGLTPKVFGLILTTLMLLSCGQIFIKLGLGKEGVKPAGNPIKTIFNILRVMFRPKTLVGFGLYVVGTFIWLMVLSKLPLSIAFPLFSMSYFFVVILSATVLKERVDWRYAITGLVLISVGVTFIGLSSPHQVRAEARHAVHSRAVNH